MADFEHLTSSHAAMDLCLPIKFNLWILTYGSFFLSGMIGSISQNMNIRYCPNNCICKGLNHVTRVYCHNLTYVPSDIPHRVEKL